MAVHRPPPRPSADAAGRHRIAVLALPGVPPFELGIPSRVFGSVLDAGSRPLYEVTVCTADGAPVLSDAGFTVQPAAGPEALAAADTVIVPPHARHRPSWPATADAARGDRRARRSGPAPGWSRSAPARSCSPPRACSTAGPPPRTGSTPTTSARLYPERPLDEAVLFIDDGDVLTSAG